MDWLPTIAELCSVDLPDRELDGQSVIPFIKSDKAPSHYGVIHWAWQSRWAVCKGPWKLISPKGDELLGHGRFEDIRGHALQAFRTRLNGDIPVR